MVITDGWTPCAIRLRISGDMVYLHQSLLTAIVISLYQAGARSLARSLSSRRRSCCFYRWSSTGTYIPNFNERSHSYFTSPAAYWFYRMDRRIRTGWLSCIAIHDWCLGIEVWYQELAAIVSIACRIRGVLHTTERCPLSRLVAMMSFMIGLWYLVPTSPRRVDWFYNVLYLGHLIGCINKYACRVGTIDTYTFGIALVALPRGCLLPGGLLRHSID